MKIYHCEYNGHFSMAMATIVAEDKIKATILFITEMADSGISCGDTKDLKIVEVDPGKESVLLSTHQE